MFALQRNARSLYCTSEHLNPCVVHILANEHPSDRRPFTTVAPEREVIMNGVNPYKRFHDHLSHESRSSRNADAEKPGKPVSRRSDFDSPPIRSSEDDRSHRVRGNNEWCQTIYSISTASTLDASRKGCACRETGRHMSRRSNSNSVHSIVRGQSLASGARQLCWNYRHIISSRRHRFQQFLVRIPEHSWLGTESFTITAAARIGMPVEIRSGNCHAPRLPSCGTLQRIGPADSVGFSALSAKAPSSRAGSTSISPKNSSWTRSTVPSSIRKRSGM